MSLKLEGREWLPFKIGDLFDTGKGVYLKKDLIVSGVIPYITAGAGNNGVMRFIGNNSLFPKDTITIEKIKLTAFYQPMGYYCSHDVSVLSHGQLNKSTGLFVAALINRQGGKYSYGRQAQLEVVRRETVFLPVTDKGAPDWVFMSQYVDSLISKRIAKYVDWCQKELKVLEYKKVEPLEGKEWKEFFLKDIFSSVQRGKRLTKADQMVGDYPYVSSTASNNGVNNFICNKLGVRSFANCMTIANSGSVGSSFFHPYKFVASDHVTHLKNPLFNSFVYLFIANQTKSLADKYNFYREINDKRISRDKIMLPVDADSDPDYNYMSQYIMNIAYRKRKKILDHFTAK